jgi:hypothetical protein
MKNPLEILTGQGLLLDQFARRKNDKSFSKK